MASLSDPTQQDRRPSPIGLTLAQSNNPFRNPRTVSPGALSPALPSPANAPGVSPRLSPTNPFLAAHELSSLQQTTNNPATTMPQSTTQPQQTSSVDKDTAQLFHRLTLVDTGPPAGAPLTKVNTNNSLNGQPPSSHKPSRSDEMERRRDPRMRPRPRPDPKKELDIFASPEKVERRPRRNSESSVISKSSMTEEERRRRERRRREQAERGGSKDRSGSKHRSSRRKPRGMDLIDRLDQTGIYGAGFFHHDGPFDAVNPHRNRRKDGRAPMQAFPANSANMMLGGSGPLNKNIDLERFHGRGAEGFTDFGNVGFDESKKSAVLSFDPLARVDPVHGEESYGLGTSTFLEGAPASRKAIERRESETQAEMLQGGGLQRKKSLAQRIRGMSRREYDGERSMIRANGPRSPNSPGTPAIPERLVQSAGGPSRASQGDKNPFDTMYDDAFDKKGAAIKMAEQERDNEREVSKSGRARAPSSPQQASLEQRLTADGAGDEMDNKKPSGGFLNRVKSLKSGRGGRGGRHGRSES
ncbi:uncharacterized protein PV09_02820 [Verruconis gallopava]|uniref:Pal1 cell morphology protein n=1 Tax=Verruconis gallopava TaxID=253628 RepID=A0A0D2B554_9PEZI|nr:uncharacterized protein PV09_02820 [Verruconis gallopava]KIW06359.1 hypothetical protein PV09_02820 [Verruconis gallopava]